MPIRRGVTNFLLCPGVFWFSPTDSFARPDLYFRQSLGMWEPKHGFHVPKFGFYKPKLDLKSARADRRFVTAVTGRFCPAGPVFHKKPRAGKG